MCKMIKLVLKIALVSVNISKFQNVYNCSLHQAILCDVFYLFIYLFIFCLGFRHFAIIYYQSKLGIMHSTLKSDRSMTIRKKVWKNRHRAQPCGRFDTGITIFCLRHIYFYID